MREHRSVIGISVLLLAIGVSTGYYLGTAVKFGKSFDWKKLSLKGGSVRKGHVLTTEAFLGSDIPLPGIKRISGKSKFLKTHRLSSN
ncbi:MAG: hypothetical protein SWO11_20600 [Thermodesulfobacteriota bacterium]|nr:hypothetical protein [Thermodesulfobacteriota bacterium]